MRKALFFLVLLMTVPVVCARAQFADASTGLLQMPTAEMQADGTFMITNNFLNKHATSTRWSYHTFQYGFAVSFWGRVELGYVCTIFNDYWQGFQSREGVWMINQDRHFTGRVLLLQEGDGFDKPNPHDDYTKKLLAFKYEQFPAFCILCGLIGNIT